MDKKQKIDKANKKIRILNRAVDQALDAGNAKAAEEFGESLHQARMARIRLGPDNG